MGIPVSLDAGVEEVEAGDGDGECILGLFGEVKGGEGEEVRELGFGWFEGVVGGEEFEVELEFSGEVLEGCWGVGMGEVIVFGDGEF